MYSLCIRFVLDLVILNIIKINKIPENTNPNAVIIIDGRLSCKLRTLSWGLKFHFCLYYFPLTRTPAPIYNFFTVFMLWTLLYERCKSKYSGTKLHVMPLCLLPFVGSLFHKVMAPWFPDSSGRNHPSPTQPRHGPGLGQGQRVGSEALVLTGGESRLSSRRVFCLFVLFCFAFFRAAPAAYGGSQVRGRSRTVAASLRHSHINIVAELPLRPTPQLMAPPDP